MKTSSVKGLWILIFGYVFAFLALSAYIFDWRLRYFLASAILALALLLSYIEMRFRL